MVEGVVGRNGQGKTLFAVRRALAELERGVPVYANFTIKRENCHVWHTPKDLLKLRHGFVIIDEANITFPSRFFAKIPPTMLYMWSQCRKLDLTIMWTAQHEDRVDKALKELTSQVWQVRRFGRTQRWQPVGPQLFRAKAYLYEELRKQKRTCLRTEWFKRGETVRLYDTEELIGLPEYLSTELAEFMAGPTFRDGESSTVTNTEINVVAKRRGKVKVEL